MPPPSLRPIMGGCHRGSGCPCPCHYAYQQCTKIFENVLALWAGMLYTIVSGKSATYRGYDYGTSNADTVVLLVHSHTLTLQLRGHKMRNDCMIMDSLYNATIACTDGDAVKQTYGRGVLVGLVSGLMSNGWSFGAVIKHLADCHTRAFWYANEREIDKACVPVSWRTDWDKYFLPA